MLELVLKNKEWLFSGLGVVILVAIIKSVRGSAQDTQGNNITINNSVKNDFSSNNSVVCNADNERDVKLEVAKNKTRILFIDDDARFKVVKILQKSGWVHTKSTKDIDSLDSHDIQETDIFFVDIQGVGIALDFRDEGLGLALAIKNKYPKKRVVIYSAESKGERFHEALRKADTFLPKNAEPYEFLQIVEGYSLQLNQG